MKEIEKDRERGFFDEQKRREDGWGVSSFFFILPVARSQEKDQTCCACVHDEQVQEDVEEDAM